MNEAFIYTIAAVAVVSGVSLLGVIALGLSDKFLRTILFYLVSFSAGALLGDVFFHLLPEMAEAGFGVKEGFYFVIGILVFFVLERFILWQHTHGEHNEEVHSSVYLTTVADSLHNFIDGIVIAASFMVSIPLGVATTLAVIFHEIPQEVGQYAILIHGGWSKGKALLYNFFSALASMLGAVIVLLFARGIESAPSFLLAFAGASFVYIAMSDLIPQLHKEPGTKKSVVQFLWLVAGLALMGALLYLE